MPKIKTKRGAAKRFRTTKSGIIKRSKAYASHILSTKTRKRKRRLRLADTVNVADAKNIRKSMQFLRRVVMADETRRGVRPGPLKVLKPILEKWTEIMSDNANWGVKDAPWWYNERASLSMFAGAVWRCKGVGL